MGENYFVPATREIEIGEGIVYRPIRSWHSGVYAGEQLSSVGGDSSGCVRTVEGSNKKRCDPPHSYTHRIYWKAGSNPNPREKGSFTISAFLSYPSGMSSYDRYHWEISPGRCEDDCIERFDTEEEMEAAVREIFRAHANPCADVPSRRCEPVR